MVNDGTKKAFYRLMLIRKIFPGSMVSNCMTTVIPGKQAAEIFFDPVRNMASVRNIYHCHKIWMCPVCARRVAFIRRRELITAMQGWEGGIFQYHLTMRHNASQGLQVLYDNLNAAHHMFKSGRWYQQLKNDFKVVGSLTSKEVTFGLTNGWHPHLHKEAFSTIEIKEPEELSGRIVERWLYCLKSVGADGDKDFCCKVTFREPGEGDRLDYPIKWGIEEELTLGTVKEGRSNNWNMFQLIEKAFEMRTIFEDESMARFLIEKYVEFTGVYVGSRQLRYDKGLKKILHVADEEVEGEELEKNDFFTGFSSITSVSRAQYNQIFKAGKLFEFQEIYSGGDIEKIKAFLSQFEGGDT